MNDGTIYVWNVIGDYSGVTLHSCVSKDTAEYLRDWCEAIVEDIWRSAAKKSGNKYEHHPAHKEFSIEEGEVIL